MTLICTLLNFIVVSIFRSSQPGEFVHTIGDAHVYMNHIEPLKEQVCRTVDRDHRRAVKITTGGGVATGSLGATLHTVSETTSL